MKKKVNIIFIVATLLLLFISITRSFLEKNITHSCEHRHCSFKVHKQCNHVIEHPILSYYEGDNNDDQEFKPYPINTFSYTRTQDYNFNIPILQHKLNPKQPIYIFYRSIRI